MLHKHRMFCSLAATLLCLASRAGSAADFTFTVPVKLSNLPVDSRTAGVSCHLYTNATARPGGRGHVGTAHGSAVISGGAFEGEITAAVDANSGVDPATVTHYSCSLSITAPLRGRLQTFSYGYAALPSTLPLKPGAPFNPQVTGTIR